jgi:hypothetical protein
MAWLKRHYPAEVTCAFFNAQSTGFYSAERYAFLAKTATFLGVTGTLEAEQGVGRLRDCPPGDKVEGAL